jgi:hypothetical protein
VIATLAFDAASHEIARVRTAMAEAVSIADQCGDERLRADLLIEDVPYHWELPMVGPRGEAAMRQARTAAARVMQPDVEARLAASAIYVARQRGQWDEAFRLAQSRVDAFRARGMPRRQLQAVISRDFLRISRCEPDDLQAVATDVRTWQPVATALHEAEVARQLGILGALARLSLGEVAGAHADLVRLWRDQPAIGSASTLRITGQVVDRRGRPVARATVAARGVLVTDSVAIGLPLFNSFDDFQDDLRLATTDETGRFEIEGASPSGAIAAQLGDLRSAPVMIAERVKLVLEPTRRITGKVELGGVAHTRISIEGAPADHPTGRFQLFAPVAQDGSFTIDGATVGALWVGAVIRGGEFGQRVESRLIPASAAPATGVVLRFTRSNRTIDVIVRSVLAAPLDGAQVILVPGKRAITKAIDLIHLQASDLQWSFAKPVTGEDIPRAVRDKVHREDLIAHIEHAALGELTVCAIGISGDLLDPESRRRFFTHLAEFNVKCEHIAPATETVVIATPPQQRFD